MNRLQFATAGLFVAWALHDLEELATMTESSRELTRRLPDWLPVPTSVRERGLTPRYLAVSIPTVGVVVAAATTRGYRTSGHSAFYQNTLLGFGLHGLGHIGVSLLGRGYTSGVATSPAVVIPFWLWATRALHQGGVPKRANVPAASAVVAGCVAVGHLTAYLVTRNEA